ncbi:MAG: hypothetical protein NVSMB32_19000 [Actinomycetota bacterium]
MTTEGSVPVHPPPVAAEPVTTHEDPAEHIHLPPPSIWPMVTAAGVSLAGLGLLTSNVFIIAGVVIMVAGIIYWIQELRLEHH